MFLKTLVYVLRTLAWLIILVFLIGWLFLSTWPGEITQSFLVYQVVLALILAFVLYLLGRDIEAYMLSAVFLLGLGLVLFEYMRFSHPYQPLSKEHTTLSVAHLSLPTSYTMPQPIVNFIKNEKIEIAGMENASQPLAAMLAKTNLLPNQQMSQSARFLAAASSQETNIRLYRLGDNKRPLLRADLNLDGQSVSVFVVNLSAPFTRRGFYQRNLQLTQLATLIQSINHPVIAIGNFNMTPFSSYYQQFLTTTGLYPSQGITWFKSTWHNDFFGLPLAHAFISKSFRFVSYDLGPYFDNNQRTVFARVFLGLTQNQTSQ